MNNWEEKVEQIGLSKKKKVEQIELYTLAW